MNKWQIMLDIAMVGIIAFITFVGIKQGFIKSFFKYMKLTIVIIITSIIGSYLVGFCQEAFVADAFEGKVSDIIVAKAEASGEAFDFEKMTEGLPTLVKKVVSMEAVKKYFNSLEGSNVEIAEKIGARIEGILISIVSKTVAYVGAFIVVYILCTVGVALLEKSCELPIINGFNKVLGCVWGLSHAYVAVSLAVCALMFILGEDFIGGTRITRLIYKFGLFTH